MTTKKDKDNARRRQNYARNKRKRQQKALAAADCAARRLDFDKEWNRRESNRKKAKVSRSKAVRKAEQDMCVQHVFAPIEFEGISNAINCQYPLF